MSRIATVVMLASILLLGACASDDVYNSRSDAPRRSSHQH